MAFNFKPLEYSPFAPSSSSLTRRGVDEPHSGWQWTETPEAFARRQASDANTQFQGYAGNQFQSLFDAVNNMGNNPAMSGEMFNNAPRYSPYGGTREQFTTGTRPSTQEYDSSLDGYRTYDPDGPETFNQQGYLDARFGNINDYLSKIGSFFGNMGTQDTQALLANMQGQGPRPVMPSVGMGSSFNPSAGGTGTHGNNPFQSFGALQSGGWGTAPTSLFGAGAGNANNT